MRIGASMLVALAALASAAPASPEGAPATKPAEPIPVDDFEAPALRPAWKTYRAKMSLVPGANGQALLVVADEGRQYEDWSSVSVALPIKDLRGVGAVSFRFNAGGGMHSLQVLLRKDGTFRSLEEVLDPSSEWRECVLPLRRMIEGSLNLLPDPADLDVLEFRWEGQGLIRLDDIRLLPGERGDASWKITEEELLELAFGVGQGQIQRGKSFSVLWEGPGVKKEDVARALRELEQYPALLASRWSLEAPPGTRIPILCAANGEKAKSLSLAMFASFQGWGHLPSQNRTMGLEPYVIATPEYLKGGDKVPTTAGLRHYLSRALGICGNIALLEAFCSALARRFDPGAISGSYKVDASDFKDRLQGKGGRILVWKELFTPEESFRNPGQLASIVEFLAACHKPRLPAVWNEIRALRVEPDDGTPGAIAKALGKSVLDLQEDWIRWGAANWK